MTVNLVAVRSLIILSACACAAEASHSLSPAWQLQIQLHKHPHCRIGLQPSLLSRLFHMLRPGQTEEARGINRLTERRWQERVRERDRYLLFRRAKSAVDRTCFCDASGQPASQSSLRPSPCQQVLGFEPGRPGSARLVPQSPWLPSRAPGPPAESSSSSLPASRNSRCKQRPVIGPSLPVFRTRPLVQACQVGT